MNRWSNLRTHTFVVGDLQVQEQRLPAYKYKEYTNSPEWKQKSDAARMANQRCSLCNRKSRPLNAHHRTYLRLGFEKPEDLTVLCVDCHDLFTKNYRYNKDTECHEPIKPIKSINLNKKNKSKKKAR